MERQTKARETRRGKAGSKTARIRARGQASIGQWASRRRGKETNRAVMGCTGRKGCRVNSYGKDLRPADEQDGGIDMVGDTERDCAFAPGL